jgi:hypothetical protein
VNSPEKEFFSNSSPQLNGRTVFIRRLLTSQYDNAACTGKHAYWHERAPTFACLPSQREGRHRGNRRNAEHGEEQLTT